MGLGPLLTAAEPAAVAGLVEGAAGAAHSGQKGGLVNQRSHLSEPGAGVGPELRSRANRPGGGAAPPTLPARTGGCGAQAHSGARGYRCTHLGRQGCGAEAEGASGPGRGELGSRRGQGQVAR